MAREDGTATVNNPATEEEEAARVSSPDRSNCIASAPEPPGDKPNDIQHPAQDVFSYLMRMGEQYSARRCLQTKKKQLEETKVCTHHPCVSAVAEQLCLQDGTRYMLPVTDRLHAMHAKQLEAQEKHRAAEQRKREAEEARELTFHPKVTPSAHAKKNRRDFPRIMDKWNEDRQRHLEDAQRKKRKEELREATGVPTITYFAAHYGHADRPPRMSIEDYLLQKGEEREERQFRRVENSRCSLHLSPECSSVRSRSSRSRSKSGQIQGISRHASERLLHRSYSPSATTGVGHAERAVVGGGRHSAARTRAERSPSPTPTFHPTVTSASTALAQRHYYREGAGENVSAAGVFDRLYYRSSHSRSPSAPPSNRCGSSNRSLRKTNTVADDDGSGDGGEQQGPHNFTHTFTPTLCPASLTMVSKRREHPADGVTRTTPVERRSQSPGTRLHAEASRRQAKLEEMRRRLLQDPQQCPNAASDKKTGIIPGERSHFKPQVTPKSKELWKRQVRALAADGSATNSQEAREFLWRSAEAYKMEQLERARALKELEAMKECTFHPETTSRSKGSLSPSRRGAETSDKGKHGRNPEGKEDQVLSVALRNENWAKRREQRIEEHRRQRQVEEIEQCTFQPQSVTKRGHSAAGRVHKSGSLPSRRYEDTDGNDDRSAGVGGDGGGGQGKKHRRSTSRSSPRESEVTAAEAFIHRQELARARRESVLQAVTLRAGSPQMSDTPVKVSTSTSPVSSRNAPSERKRGVRRSSSSPSPATVHVDPLAALKLSPEDREVDEEIRREKPSVEGGREGIATATAHGFHVSRRDSDEEIPLGRNSGSAVHRALVFWPSWRGQSSVRASVERHSKSAVGASVSSSPLPSRASVSASRSQSRSSPRNTVATVSDYDWRASVQ